MSVRVHIERLVLDGFSLDAAEGRQVKAAVQRELTRLLTANGLSDELRPGGAFFSVRAGAFSPPRNAPASDLGPRIARSVHGGIGKAK
jgi:hypothetical protein